MSDDHCDMKEGFFGCDNEFKEIKKALDKLVSASTAHSLGLKEIQTYNKINIGTLKMCREETKKNTNAITSIRVKQRLITWLGSISFVSLITASIKYISSHWRH